MPNSAERNQPIAGLIMVAMMIAAIVGFMWCIKHSIEESWTPKQTINKHLNK